MSQHEHTLNIHIGNALRGMRRRWRVHAETLGATADSRERLDILITEAGAAPLVIEHETMPALDVESEAKNRLGRLLRDSPQDIRASIALRSPATLRDKDETELAAALHDCQDFEYALFRGRIPIAAERWPERGWLRGRLQDLALLAQQAMRPSEEIDTLADALQSQIDKAATVFSQAYLEGREDVAELMSTLLKLEDGPQTRRMAMAIIANALIFQQNLAPHFAEVRTPSTLYNQNRLRQIEVLADWRAILRRNYFPIFHLAREFLAWIDRPEIAENILLCCFHEGQEVRHRNLERSHELVGFVFQRLIADRKFLATFYTRPESAALLAALALPQTEHWGDAEQLKNLRVADFACGTGTLLAAAYQRLAALHELAGGDAEALHRVMIEEVLVGADVLPMATHLTLSMLAAAYPEQTFEKTHIITAPYGRQREGEAAAGEIGDIEASRYRLGALDLLEMESVTSTLPTQPALMQDHGVAIGGKGETAADIPHGGYDLVIMNPPFTRPTNHAAGHKDIPNPAFAAFGVDADSQRALSERGKVLAKGTPANGYAGMASYFLALADKKLKPGGVMAMVLPLVVLSGMSWEKTRHLLRKQYSGITVATIAGAKSYDKAFSADTGLGECLLIAHKQPVQKQPRARFMTLRKRPRNEWDGLEVGRAVNTVKRLHRLEDGPLGGTPIQVGEDEIGQLLDYPLPDSGPWQLAGIQDFSLAQSTFQLALGQVWLPRIEKPVPLPITLLGQIAEIGPVHRLINGASRAGEPLGPFDIKKPAINPAPTYPTLWAHDAPRERCMELTPDSEAIVRHSDNPQVQSMINKKAVKIWATAARTHMPTDFRYNSQSLAVSITKVACIGGRAWPSIIFPEPKRELLEYAFTAWGNCTLGILCFWWQANRQQGGRGVTSVTALPALPTLDLRRLSPEQLAAAARIFADHKNLPMLPINQIDEDENRAELDRRLLTEALGLPAELCTGADSPLALLRRKLAAEPSIHGGKKSRVVL